eukprot:143374-Chlamydomonas_euryale.AAC.2
MFVWAVLGHGCVGQTGSCLCGQIGSCSGGPGWAETRKTGLGSYYYHIIWLGWAWLCWVAWVGVWLGLSRIELGGRLQTSHCRRVAGGCRRVAGGCRRVAGDCRRVAGDCRHVAGGCRRVAGGCKRVASRRQMSAS